MQDFRRKGPVLGAMLALAALGACGQTVGEQAVIGGAAGAATGAVVGGDALAGAVVGAGGNVAFCQLNPGQCR